MNSSTMNLHHAVTIFVMILALIALIIASIAISGDINYQEDSIPGKAINNHVDLFRAGVDSNLYNATLSGTDEESISAVVNTGTLKNTNDNHLHIEGTVVQSSATDLNLLFGSSNIAGFNAGGDVLQDIPIGVTSEGIRFSNVSRRELTTKNQEGYVEIGVDKTTLNTNYRVNLPSDAPTAGKVLEVDTTDITKLRWGDKAQLNGTLTNNNADMTFTIQGEAAGGDLTLSNTSTGTNKDIVIDSTSGNVDIDAGGNVDIDAGGHITLDVKNASSINIGTSNDTEYVTSNINIGTSATGRTITIGNALSSLVDVNATSIDIDAGATGIAIDASGPISIGTGDFARTISLGSVTSTAANVTATAITLTSTNALTLTDGTATLSLGGTDGTSLTAATTVNLGCTGAMSLNSSGGAINIGNNDIDQDINIGTQGERTINIGNTSGATELKLDCGSGGLNIATSNNSNPVNIGTSGTRTIKIGHAATTLIDINAGTGGVDIDTRGPIGITSSENTADSIVIESSAGGINILASAAEQGQDIDIVATGSSVNITSSESASDAIHLIASGTDGGINIDANAGGIDIDCTQATGNLSLDTAGGQIQIGANAAAGNISIGTNVTARTITLGNAFGTTSLDIDAGTGGIDIASGGVIDLSSAGEMNINTTTSNSDIKIVPNGTGDIEIGGASRMKFTSGGSITQSLSKATGVILNKRSGKIIMNEEELASGTEVSFLLSNTTITPQSIVLVNHVSGGTAGSYIVQANNILDNGCSITVSNISTGDLTQTIVLHFLVLEIAVV